MKTKTNKRSRNKSAPVIPTEPMQTITSKRFYELCAVEVTASNLCYALDAYYAGKQAGDFRLLYKVTNARRDVMDALRGIPIQSTMCVGCTGLSSSDPSL